MALKEHISKFVKELLKKHQIIVKKKVTLKKEGKISEQGKRTDLQDVTSDVQEGIPLDDIAMDHPETWIKYHKGITSLWNIVNIKHRNEKDELKVIWIYGKAGVWKNI